MQNSKMTPKVPTKVVRNKGNDDTKTDIKRVVKTPTKIVNKPENNYVVIDKTKNDKNYITISTNKKYEIEDNENDYYELSPNETVNFTKKRIIKLTNAKDSDSDYELTPEETVNFTKKRIIKSQTKVIDNSDSDDSDSDDSDDSEDDSDDKLNYDRRSINMVDYNRMLFELNSHKSKDSLIRKAWKSLEKYELPDKNNLKIIKSHPGHFVMMGHYTGSLRNPHWLVENKDKNKYYIMYCKTNGYTKFSEEDYKDIINPSIDYYPTWHFEKNGYILTKSYNKTKGHMYLHQLVCQKHNEKKYVTQSVDHINCNKLDNRHTNLRFATQSQQNQNTTKRVRKNNACELPEGIDQQRDIPKFGGYRPEHYGPNKKHFRHCFTIEKHPLQNIKKNIKDSLPEGQNIEQSEFPIRWTTTKSNEVDIFDKLKLMQQKRKLYDEEFKRLYPDEYKEWIHIGGNKKD
jgi:hypothetical protein